MTSFSLVHGAWHGAWAWDLLRGELESRGHGVTAPELPCEDVTAGVRDYASLVPPADVAVGHSLGGYTLPLVEAGVHVYLCALLPGVDEEFVPGFGEARVRDELGRSYYPDWRDGARELQYPDEHAHLARLLRRQARLSATEPIGDTRSVYVVCTRDACVSPAWQRRVAADFETVELDAGHSPMLTHVRELADVLCEV
jgi:Alpha/beta hydrolase family